MKIPQVLGTLVIATVLAAGLGIYSAGNTPRAEAWYCTDIPKPNPCIPPPSPSPSTSPSSSPSTSSLVVPSSSPSGSSGDANNTCGKDKNPACSSYPWFNSQAPVTSPAPIQPTTVIPPQAAPSSTIVTPKSPAPKPVIPKTLPHSGGGGMFY